MFFATAGIAGYSEDCKKAHNAARGHRQAGGPESTTLYVGNDMRNDIYPSHALGFRTALFAGDQRSLRLRSDDPRYSRLKPDLVVTDLRQLLQFVFFMSEKKDK